MKTVEVEIRGVSPLLVHRFGESAEQAGQTRRVRTSEETPREAATRAAYVAKDGTFYFSAFSIPRSMANVGANHKNRGNRKTLKFVVPGAVRVVTDAITILDPATNKPAKDFDVDGRPVTIPATKGRIMRYRPRWDAWSAKFSLEIEDTVLGVDTAHQLLNEAGVQVGIGDFRPEKSGPFGRFRVVKFDEMK